MPIDSSDIEAILGRDLTAVEATRAERLAELAAGKLEATMPGFTLAEDTETVAIYPPQPGQFWTPKYPVSALTIEGITPLRFTEKGLVRFGWALPLNAFDWPLISPLSVTYTFGFDTLPGDVVSIIAEMVAATIRRQATNQSGLSTMTVGSYSEGHFQSEVDGLAAGMPVPADALTHWRRREMSVALTR